MDCIEGMKQLDKKYVLEKLKPVFESEKIRKYGQNIKYDLIVLENRRQEIYDQISGKPKGELIKGDASREQNASKYMESLIKGGLSEEQAYFMAKKRFYGE